MKVKMRHKWLVDKLLEKGPHKQAELEQEQGKKFGNVFTTGDTQEYIINKQSKKELVTRSDPLEFTDGQKLIFEFNTQFEAFKNKYPDFVNQANGYDQFQQNIQEQLADIRFKERFGDAYRKQNPNATPRDVAQKADELKKDLRAMHVKMLELQDHHKQHVGKIIKRGTPLNACKYLVNSKLGHVKEEKIKLTETNPKPEKSKVKINVPLAIGLAFGGVLFAAGVVGLIIATGGMAAIPLAAGVGLAGVFGGAGVATAAAAVTTATGLGIAAAATGIHIHRKTELNKSMSNFVRAAAQSVSDQKSDQNIEMSTRHASTSSKKEEVKPLMSTPQKNAPDEPKTDERSSPRP